jgi:hypothetical protein
MRRHATKSLRPRTDGICDSSVGGIAKICPSAQECNLGPTAWRVLRSASSCCAGQAWCMVEASSRSREMGWRFMGNAHKGTNSRHNFVESENCVMVGGGGIGGCEDVRRFGGQGDGQSGGIRSRARGQDQRREPEVDLLLHRQLVGIACRPSHGRPDDSLLHEARGRLVGRGPWLNLRPQSSQHSPHASRSVKRMAELAPNESRRATQGKSLCVSDGPNKQCGHEGHLRHRTHPFCLAALVGRKAPFF